MLLKVLVGRLQSEATHIHPGKVGGLHGEHMDAWQVLPDEGIGPLIIAPQHLEDALQPGPAMAVGCLAADIAEAVDLGDHSARGLLETQPQGRIRYQDETAGQAGHVVGLAGGHQGQAVLIGPRIDIQDSVMPGLFVQNQVTVDLIRDQKQVVALAEIHQLPQLIQTPDPTHRVVRIAQDEEAGPVMDGPFHPLKIKDIAIPLDLERDGQQLLVLPFRGGQERRIDGGVRHDSVTRLLKRP